MNRPVEYSDQLDTLVQVLRYAKDHNLDLVPLLLALSWGTDSTAALDEREVEPTDVPPHHYPH